MLYTADFETTTDELDCRVWAWGVCQIGNPNYFEYGNTIESFFEFMEKSDNATFYFHNLKFDAEFLMVYLFENGYTHVKSMKEEKDKTFSTLISDKGMFYSIRIVFEKKNKKSKYVTIYDSLKILPFSVSQIAKGFNLPISKLELDYDTYREYGHELTEHEIEYLRNDVDIVARALNILFSQDLRKMTQGSNALHDYKSMIGKKRFDRCFPTPDYDADVRQSYKGGFTYLNPKYKSKDIGKGFVIDVNSLYPWVMYECPLPYGNGIFYKGKYVKDEIYPLYVQMITCQFKLKDGYIPTIQMKNNLNFIPTQYLESSADDKGNLLFVTLCLTSIDLELFLEHYHVYNPTYHSGWKFKATTNLFKEYIDKWITIKNESTINGNKAMRTLAKLMLNALYGKFALNPNVCSKIPYYDEGRIRYTMGTPETRKPLYIPVGTFITAYARRKTITSAQKMYDNFVYADTDSLHLNFDLPDELMNMDAEDFEKLTTEDLIKYGVNLPEDFDIHPTRLGAWKTESKFYRARFVRQKSYIEDSNEPRTWNTDDYQPKLLKITCAGMPEQCYPYVTWENFFEGSSYSGKLMQKHVVGGIVLKDTNFTIKRG